MAAKRILSVVVVMACAAAAVDATRVLHQAADVPDSEVLGFFDTWNAALLTRHPKKVTALYARDAVLLPTVSNIPRDTPAKIEDYFKTFLKYKPVGVINKYYIQRSGNVIINSGIYTFKLNRGGGYVESVPARFTFVYTLIGGKWLITKHHSSAMPETPLPKESEIKALFAVWNKALLTRSPKKVAALYTKDAILLPTVSNVVRDTPAKIEDYFKTFLKYKPVGSIDEQHVLIWSPTLATNAGIYTFLLHREGRVDKVQARFTFVYHKVNGVWRIAEHHSSGMPEQKVPSQKEVHHLFDLWNNALKAKDVNRLLSLYAPDSILLPTLNGKVMATRADKKAYFEQFIKLSPVGRITEEHIKVLAPTVASNDGLYSFAVTQYGKRTTVKARYSFTYTKIGSKWFIQQHHSSKVPK